MRRLAIVTTHPIQYYAPIFQLLSRRGKIDLKVFYTIGMANYASKIDPGFGRSVDWDIPLLDGYPYSWADNSAADPGTRDFRGIVTPKLVNQLNEWEPDAILVFGWAYLSHLKILLHFKNKVPVYFRGDSTVLNEPLGIKKILKLVFLRWVYSHVDHVFFVGINNKAYFTRYGLKNTQLTFAPHAIDNERFVIDRGGESSQLRRSLDLEDQDILILYAGKFEMVKNVPLLLSAFIALNRANVHLLLVGNGEYEIQLKNAASKSPMPDNIHFLDFKNQTYMPVIYQSADLFCLPSKSESWGLSVNEAMACGKAILASDKVGCAADLVKPGENGAVFRSDDADSLTQCLRLLTADRTALTDMGKRSRSMIAQWSFLNIVKAIENKIVAEDDHR